MASLVNWKLFDSKGFYTEKIYAQEEQPHGQPSAKDEDI
jgi:hypothetical protein